MTRQHEGMHANKIQTNRRSIRIRDFDYRRNGHYFITVCSHHRGHLFGEIEHGIMHDSRAGRIARDIWHELPGRHPHITLDEFTLMPDHIHAIITIDADAVNTGAINRAPTGLGEIVRGFKARCTHAIHRIPEYANQPIWQRNYYERIIRNDVELHNTRQYIRNNPAAW